MTEKSMTTLAVDAAGKNIELGGKVMLKDLSFFFTATDRDFFDTGGNIVVREPESVEGADLVGDWKGVKRSFYREYVDSKGRSWEMENGSMEVRIYDDVFAIKGQCKVETSLPEENHYRAEIGEIVGLKDLLAIHNSSDWWTRPVFDKDISKLQRSHMFLWQAEDGTYGCIVALVHGGCRSMITGRTGKLGIDQVIYDGGRDRTDAFVCVGGFGDNPYELVTRCVQRGMDMTGRPGKLRWEKPYPKPFDKIGWCTWDAFYADVNEEGILQKMEQVKKEKFPFKWLLIDDGWSPLKERRLASFDIDREKFPRGMKALVDELDAKYGIENVGVWHTFTGYWRGINEDTDIYKLNKDYILDSKRNSHIPYPEATRSFGFWNAWHSHLRTQGISFVKVDNQGATYHHSRGIIPIGDAGKGQQYGLQSSAGLNFNGSLLNCMCMLPENAWHWVSSNVSRNSDDFWPKRLESAPDHARQNIYANLLYHNFSWPDWDMWWSQHPRAQYHAALRAISGGPVYVSDKVDEGDFSLLWPFILSDGTLLRCDNPALPTRDSIFLNPQENPVPLKAFSFSGKAGMLLAANATDGEPIAKGSFKPSDIDGIEGSTFAVREFFSGETKVMQLEDQWNLEIEPYAAKLFVLAPIENGFAAIGLVNKYVSPATVAHSAMTDSGAVVTLKEGGEFAAYCDKQVKRVSKDGEDIKFSQEDGWLSASISGSKAVDVVIEW